MWCQGDRGWRQRAGFALLVWLVAASSGAAEEQADPSRKRTGGYRLEEVTVTAEALRRAGPFLPDVVGTGIYAGKKTAVIALAERPAVVNNNFRQVLTETPGLLLSEETTPLFSVGYRGLDPHRAQFTQVLEDGVPIHAEMFGYPEAYYVPPLQGVERIEFVHGGAGLMYGPQPGGALNFVTKDPVAGTPFAAYTEHSVGDDELFSTYTSLSGTIEPLGYRHDLHEREGNGFREGNSDFEVLGGGLTLSLAQGAEARWTMRYNEYHEEHGEPGGLTKAVADSEGRDQTTRFHDRFRLARHFLTLAYEHAFSETTQMEFRTFGGYYRRYSKRQRGGGFGTLPSGSAASTNSIEKQEFYTYGLEPRIRHTYSAFGQDGHTLTAGLLAYFSSSPREDERGGAPDADAGTLRNSSNRALQYLSLFAEQLVRFGRFSVTPGVRVEHLWQHVREETNVDKTDRNEALGKSDEFDFVPLFGLGAAYDLTPSVRAYTNWSQGYRPKIFTQAVPTGATQVVNGDLEEGKGWTFDAGLRGRHADVFHWDASYFVMSFTDQIGTSGNTIENVGDALHQGVELSADADLMGLHPYVNLMLLDATFTEGPQDGKTPQYAPQYTVRFGVQYAYEDRLKMSLGSTFVDDHFADDANTANRTVPSYTVWDLTGELLVWRRPAVALFGGINNLFDERYYARIRSEGIDPAPERNLYGGLKISVQF